MKKFFLIIITSLISLSLQAQFLKAKLGITGLTCSLCSYSVEKSIRQLPFVHDIKMDLNESRVEVIFKANKLVSLHSLIQKVYDAGFSVSELKAVFAFNEQLVEDNYLFNYADENYCFIQTGKKLLVGEVTLTIIDKRFFLKKEFKEWKSLQEQASTSNKETKINYFVTL